MNTTSRPIRERKQPLGYRDKVELNMELIERLENSKSRNTGNIPNTNGKLLVAFINAVNESFRINRDEAKEKQSDAKKEEEESKKLNSSINNAQNKKSKLNDGRVIQHQFKPSKGESKKAERVTENRQSELNKKSRPPNSYSKRESQKVPPNEKQAQGETFSKNNNVISIKPFKRYSFHAAIAYQIHLEKLKLKNNNVLSPQELDPTYPAKRLKEEQAKAVL